MDFLLPFAPYYYFVYWFIVMLMTIRQYSYIKKCQDYALIKKSFDYQPIIVFSFFFILFYGFRPFSGVYFGDTPNYAQKYELLEMFGVFDHQGSDDLGSDWIFNYLMKYCSQIINVHLWFTIVLSCYIVPMIAGCKLLDSRHGALLFLFCICAFEFYSFAVNGIRNGMACSIVILALALLNKGKLIWAIVLSFIALGCHKSTVLPSVCMFFVFFVRKPKLMFIAWLGAIVISLAAGNYIDNILSMFNFDNRLAGNLQMDEADGVIIEHRFRWDFLLYSSMPILLGWYTIFKRKLYDKTYLLLLGTYMYANSIWVLAIRAMFSNRIAYLSWFIYPIVLAYPLLNLEVFKKKHSKKTAIIFLAHFGFTTILWLLGK